ncbi:MAG: PEP/pyruvate-binding domain-containing protein [Spirochaetes bacterium]|jgi:pyruvate,water dikinase|nr:PEP/pyruvate-binding domain-containing protein [Spirochaetota bacterium]
MSCNHCDLSTGIKNLDSILKGLLPGDNIVWQVNTIDEYSHFTLHYARAAELYGQNLVYFRFASHDPLISSKEFPTAQIYDLDPNDGFEQFITAIHGIIKQNGRGGYYIFDSLSDLSNVWFSDRMLGNFFMLTCPYLLDMEALAYFAILRREHSNNALSPIHITAQVILDVYTSETRTYVHPLKVQQRYSRTMHMLHIEEEDGYFPVTNSALNSEILSFSPFQTSSGSFEEKDIWNRNFSEALRISIESEEEKGKQQYLQKLLKMTISRDEKILSLASKFFTIEDLIETGRRMIGTGLVGGKTTGMLLSRAMLKKSESAVKDIIEVHDSFFVGADVFYTYMVINGCWWIRHQQKDIDVFLTVAEYARRVILTGSFPDEIVAKLSDMLDYFGQSPIIVRSSSLLEDNFGNAFSGKYESIFCPNQGSRERRLENLLTAIKTIYASTLSEKALHYRAHLGILDKDEQMPLLIQRVSGDLHGRYFFPAVGGVGYSYNPYVWDSEIDPASGVIRIVYGMGTRAVDRSDDDYTRIAALNAVMRRPESGIDELRRFSQKNVDVIDLEANQLVAADFSEVSLVASQTELNLIASRDRETNSWFITFNGLFEDTAFVSDISAILKILEKAYSYPVDIEFTVNFTEESEYRINIVQCRPFEARENSKIEFDTDTVDEKDLVLASQSGPVIGRNREFSADLIIYVSSESYDVLNPSGKHTVARTIGKIMRQTRPEQKVVLIGPGRWGTTTVSLGIPVTFSEICRAACVCEVVEMREGLIPDVSLGTHFFNDLVEFDILYLAFYPHKDGNSIDKSFFTESPNVFKDYIQDNDSYQDIIRVIKPEFGQLVVKADSINQKYLVAKV